MRRDGVKDGVVKSSTGARFASSKHSAGQGMFEHIIGGNNAGYDGWGLKPEVCVASRAYRGLHSRSLADMATPLHLASKK